MVNEQHPITGNGPRHDSAKVEGVAQTVLAEDFRTAKDKTVKKNTGAQRTKQNKKHT
jgi:hypothetical protein